MPDSISNGCTVSSYKHFPILCRCGRFSLIVELVLVLAFHESGWSAPSSRGYPMLSQVVPLLAQSERHVDLDLDVELESPTIPMT